MAEVTLKVEGMHCTSCDLRVKLALEEIPGVGPVEANHETGKVTVHSIEEVEREKLVKAIENEGFEVVD